MIELIVIACLAADCHKDRTSWDEVKFAQVKCEGALELWKSRHPTLEVKSYRCEVVPDRGDQQ